jgi:AraC-like DNA-binding protein
MNLKMLNNTIFENVNNSNGNFTKHFHDTYTIGLTHDGLFKSINEKKATFAYKNSTRIINPGEIHHGDSNSWKYTNFYPSIELLSDIHEQIFFERRVPIFQKHIIEDLTLYKLLEKFFISAYKNEDKLTLESNLIDALAYLVKNYTHTTKNIDAFFNTKIIIKDSIEFIKDNLDTKISLEELSLNSNLSKYHFLRVFKKDVGLTPHHYILTQRIHRAKERILNGETLLEASLNSGFNDQSHFIRNFKTIYGYLPKELLQKSNFILYK